MKKWIIASGLMVMITMGTFAQQKRGGERPNPEERAKAMTEKMAKELELTEDQQKQVLAINLEYAQKREAEMAKRKVEMEARRAKMEEAKAEAKEQNTKINAVLTEEQKSKWTEIKQENQDKRKGQRMRRPGGEIRDMKEVRSRRGSN